MTRSSPPAAGRALPPLRLGAKLGYASGGIVDGVATQAVNIFLFFYVTTVCGLPPGLAGIALAMGLVVDALVDPLIGSLSDASHARLGRRLPFMLAGLPGVALFLAAIFALPRGLSTAALFAWLSLLSIGLRICLSLFLLPYNAVGAELSDDHGERSSIAAWRWGFAIVGALAAILLGFGVFLAGPRGLAERGGYPTFGVTLAMIVIAAALVATHALRGLRSREHRPIPRSRHPLAELLAGLGEIVRNPSFRTLFAGALLLFTALGMHATLGLHANTYFWRLAPAQIQLVTLALFAGLLLGAPLAGPLLRRLEKRVVLLIGMVGLAVAYGAPAALRLAGLLTLQGASLAALLALTVLLGGMLMAAAAIAFLSMMADAADEHEHLFGTRREGLYFAGWSLASKAAAGLGSLFAGLTLQASGFPAGNGALRVAPHVADAIGAIQGLGSGLIALLAASTCLFYRLDRAHHAEILDALTSRRRPPCDSG